MRTTACCWREDVEGVRMRMPDATPNTVEACGGGGQSHPPSHLRTANFALPPPSAPSNRVSTKK